MTEAENVLQGQTIDGARGEQLHKSIDLGVASKGKAFGDQEEEADAEIDEDGNAMGGRDLLLFISERERYGLQPLSQELGLSCLWEAGNWPCS